MKAYELLSKRGSWTKGAYARTRLGELCGTKNPLAVKFCTIGALEKTYSNKYKFNKAMNKLKKYLDSINKYNDIYSWNDTDSRTRKQVVTVLKKLDL